MDTQTARIQYIESGYDAIPLKPQEKLPLAKGWQTKATITQWKNAAHDANIGLRAGHGKAFIDCDDKNHPGTFATIERWLAGLGYIGDDLPVVQTPSAGGIGRHVYVNFKGSLFGSKRNLSKAIGAGEFRYDYGSYVAAPPSVITGTGEYKLISGKIDHLPVLDLMDISRIVNLSETVTEKKGPLKMSRLAIAIANGTKPDRSSSNSDGEATLVLSLINSGYDYETIKQIFNSFPCLGHYSAKHAARGSKEAERWLSLTYSEMLKYSQRESNTRRVIGDYLEKLCSVAWSNANSRLVLLSHLGIAYKAGKFEYAASVRDLALGAGVQTGAVRTQTRRLVKDGLLSLRERGKGVSASVWKLEEENLTHSLSTEYVRKCVKFSGHDAFRNGGGRYAKGRLGRRAGEVYELIYDNPLTLEEIAEQTGAHKKTVASALRKLSNIVDFHTGEIIEMVVCEGDTWRGVIVDLEHVAAIMRTYGATGKQRADYARERREHHRALEIGTIKAHE